MTPSDIDETTTDTDILNMVGQVFTYRELEVLRRDTLRRLITFLPFGDEATIRNCELCIDRIRERQRWLLDRANRFDQAKNELAELEWTLKPASEKTPK